VLQATLRQIASSIIVLMIFTLSMVPGVDARELLRNGDFESGKSGWNPWHCKGPGAVGIVYSVSEDTRPGSTGKQSLQIDTTDAFACANFIRRSAYGLEGGKKYRISIWYKVIAGGDPDGPVENVIAREQKEYTNQDRVDLYFDMTVDGKWKYVSGEFTAEQSTTVEDFYSLTVNPVPRDQGGAGGIIRVDDFSLWDFAPAPATPDTATTATPLTEGDVLAKLLNVDAGAEAKRSKGVEAGTLGGFPYLRNEQVIYLWDKAENGAGLLRLRDLRTGRQLLTVDQAEATLWKIEAKSREGQARGFDNVGVPCEVSFEASEGEAKLVFEWQQPNMQVKVQTRLVTGESLARSRMTINTKGQALGLQTVTFPIITGIAPLTAEGKQDKILISRRRGATLPSPVVSKETIFLDYPIEINLPMGALLGDGMGLYFGEEDEQANEKHLYWIPDEADGTLTYSAVHPVLGWGGDELVTAYASPGDVVMGPFQGDWFDAARIYRRWAITAPWCAKGLIHQREDYPQWLARVPYWTDGALRDKEGIEQEHAKHDFFDLPESLCHDYYYTFGFRHHDRNPEYLPPRIGTENYKRVIKDLRKRGVRVIPYVIGLLWNMTTESYRTEDAEKSAILGRSGDVIWTWAGGDDPQAAMCPHTQQWRDKLTSLSKELIGKYGFSGIYFDYFTVHKIDCWDQDHGHPIAGGNYWTKSVHELYEQVRSECRKMDPQLMFCGENVAEWCIDVLDTCYEAGPESDTPIFLAIYHGYTQIFSGGLTNRFTPPFVGRQWLMGCQNGWLHQEYAIATSPEPIYRRAGPFYKTLVQCHWEFARPYLGYGEMLRPPAITGALPTIDISGHDPPFTVNAVEGSAWRASDGSVGIFFVNYDDESDHEFTWTKDLNEIAGIGTDKKVKVTLWTPAGEKVLGEWSGGVVGTTMNLESWGMIALKLEVVQ